MAHHRKPINSIKQHPNNDFIIKEAERQNLTQVSNSQWRRYEKAGIAPHRIHLGQSSVGWRMSELQAWIRGEWRGESK